LPGAPTCRSACVLPCQARASLHPRWWCLLHPMQPSSTVSMRVQSSPPSVLAGGWVGYTSKLLKLTTCRSCPLLSAHAGAVVYGSTPHLIHARRSKYTYGIRCNMPWTSDAPDKEWSADHNAYYTFRGVQTYVAKGQQVRSLVLSSTPADVQLQSPCCLTATPHSNSGS
jgi:hypothetical protein